MDKMKMQSPDGVDENLDRIAQFFPGCITETRDADGTVKRAVDFDLLRQELSAEIVEGPVERYQLNWPGKRQAIATANAPVTKTLRPCREESVDFDTTGNLYIEGDNLDVLKLLQETYLGKIKMIYIDPPYNTGKDFIYKDNFTVDKDAYEEASGQRDESGGRLIANLESNGRYHSDWLSMMLPRLRLARNLLSDDGVIFISIDDWEVGALRKICDEIMGPDNFIGLFCRKTKSGGGSASAFCAVEHDYVMAFAKNAGGVCPLFCEFGDDYLKRYKDVDSIGPYFWDTMERSSTKTKPYKIEAPDGTMLTGKWFRSEDTFRKDLARGEVRFLKKTDGWSVQFKQRLADGKKLRTILEEHDLTDKKYRSLTEELENIVGCSLGHPPKPIELMSTLVCSVCRKTKDTDIILDFFSGSATTAHAVMQLNATDGGNRKFIMVQLPEACEEASEAFKAGYKNICEIGKERIRRAGKKVKMENATTTPDLDIGFRVLKLDSSNMRDVYYTPDKLKQEAVELFTAHIKEDRKAEDLLFQVLLDWGIPLSARIEQKKLGGRSVYLVNETDILACFEQGITEEAVKQFAAIKPLRAVFRDDAFDDCLKINVEQIFKVLSPKTEVKAI